MTDTIVVVEETSTVVVTSPGQTVTVAAPGPQGPGGGGTSGQSGDGSPIGVVTPTAIGSQYTDTASGGLYLAPDTNRDHWQLIGGTKPGTPARVVDTNNELIYTSALSLFDGDGTTVQVVDDGPSTPFSITTDLVAKTMVIHLATDSGDVVTTTVQDIHDGIEADSQAIQLVIPFTVESFVGSDLASATWVLTLIGAAGTESVYADAGGLVVHGSGSGPSFTVVGASDQPSLIATLTCDGYGIWVDNHGTLVTVNDGDNPCFKVWANDGGDLALEVDGHGNLLLPLAGTGVTLPNGNTLFNTAAVPDNAVGVDGDWSIGADGNLYFKAAGVCRHERHPLGEINRGAPAQGDDPIATAGAVFLDAGKYRFLCRVWWHIKERGDVFRQMGAKLCRHTRLFQPHVADEKRTG